MSSLGPPQPCLSLINPHSPVPTSEGSVPAPSSPREALAPLNSGGLEATVLIPALHLTSTAVSLAASPSQDTSYRARADPSCPQCCWGDSRLSNPPKKSEAARATEGRQGREQLSQNSPPYSTERSPGLPQLLTSSRAVDAGARGTAQPQPLPAMKRPQHSPGGTWQLKHRHRLTWRPFQTSLASEPEQITRPDRA